MLVDHIPLVALRLTTPRLELRLPEPEEVAALGELAAEGIHDPDVMPFLVPWTDQPPERSPAPSSSITGCGRTGRRSTEHTTSPCSTRVRSSVSSPSADEN